jgi:polysaccharide pyruvyl transferase WcaK-like protein
MNAKINSVRAKYPSSLLVGLDFYGAGNIGDDLMVAGFVQALSILNPASTTKVYCNTYWDVESQRIRFPEISWRHTAGVPKEKVSLLSDVECWAGVGDTPFQLTSGDWCLKDMLSQLETIQKFKSRVMVSVGAETEIQPRAKDFARVASVFERISTRDEHSSQILIDMVGVPSSLVFTGSDLANISLPNILDERRIEKKFALGLIVAGDTLSNKDISEVGRFIASQKEPVGFIAGETRMVPYAERGVFAKLTRLPWSRVRGKASLEVPLYSQCSLYDLIHPICACETVISTRYHGLLAAAWAGCKVAAISRSSKVAALADILGIPYHNLPVTGEKLESLQNEASKVSPDILNDLRDKALSGVSFALEVR